MEASKREDVQVNTEVNLGTRVTRFVVLVVAVAGVALASLEGPATQAAVAPAQQVLPASHRLAPGPAVLAPGAVSARVRIVQARLRQLGWYAGLVDDHYGPRTTAAVKGFQARRGLPSVGYLDEPTLDRLRAMTRRPNRDELANRTVAGQGSGGTWTTARLDDRCRTGHVMCIDKSSRTIRWVVDGEVRKTMAVRFGSAYTPTREGVFHVGWKSRDHVSTLFHTAMPFAMFFSGGEAVHYSSDFAARGYAGASHGCVNVRDYNGVKWLFSQVRVGDKVVVSWS